MQSYLAYKLLYFYLMSALLEGIGELAFVFEGPK